MDRLFIEFCKKVGIVAGAAAGVLLLLNMGAGFAWSVASRPLVEKIAEQSRALMAAIESEARARETADKEMLRDRLDLIDVMMTPLGPARERKLAETRARWERR